MWHALFPKIPDVATLENASTEERRRFVQYNPAEAFALAAGGAGLLCSILVPEFLYLRDNFGARINTIFKFYYQAWVVLGVASGYAVFAIWDSKQPKAPRYAYGVLLGVVVFLGALYPVFGVYSRAYSERSRIYNPNQPLVLDGGADFINTADYKSIMCLGNLVKGDQAVVAEAIGGPYDEAFGRVAALTGIPIVIGWENHEATVARPNL